MEQNTYELINKAKNGDNLARDELFENNMGLVYSIAKRFLNRGVEFDDLVQIGSIGLFNAINKFDESYNVMFSTYAVPLILGEIKRFLRDNGPVKVSRNLRSIALKANVFRENYIKEHGKEPTISEIANELGIDCSELATALEATQVPESLYAKVDDSEKILLVDKISGGVNNENTIIDKTVVIDLIGKLTERERKIIIMRYFKDKKQTEIAKYLGISQVQVSRLEKQILNKLRQDII